MENEEENFLCAVNMSLVLCGLFPNTDILKLKDCLFRHSLNKYLLFNALSEAFWWETQPQEPVENVHKRVPLKIPFNSIREKPWFTSSHEYLSDSSHSCRVNYIAEIHWVLCTIHPFLLKKIFIDIYIYTMHPDHNPPLLPLSCVLSPLNPFFPTSPSFSMLLFFLAFIFCRSSVGSVSHYEVMNAMTTWCLADSIPKHSSLSLGSDIPLAASSSVLPKSWRVW